MKRIVFLTFSACIAVLLFTGCNKMVNVLFPSDGVEIFLLKSFETVGDSRKINEKSVVRDHYPLVEYSDILSYDSVKHSFKVSDMAVDAVKNIQHSVFGVAFALTVDGKIVYTGYFWPSFSSATCDWITIEPLLPQMTKELKVELGYPGDWEGVEDRRNDPRIISVLKRDKKLK
jgi:hypothetical protein